MWGTLWSATAPSREQSLTAVALRGTAWGTPSLPQEGGVTKEAQGATSRRRLHSFVPEGIWFQALSTEFSYRAQKERLILPAKF